MANLKEMNRVFSEINLGDFYDTDYCDYAIYRALQRIPSLIDGFAQTQRKVVYTMIDQNIDKKTKVSDLAAVVSLATKYHHGSMSIESTITNLVPQWNNQVPLLREDGTYGSRSEREASASRYIESRLYKYSKVIFNKIDNELFVKKQVVEGKKIEPANMLPIVPLLLVNGQSQIGVGYSSDVLPRDIKVVLKLMREVLTGKRKEIPTEIPPAAPLFKGTILKNPKSGWDFYGIVEELKKGDVHITEVPPRYTRESYMNVLEALKDAGKIKSYNENIVGDDFDITVKFGSLAVLNDTIKLDSKTDQNVRNLKIIQFLKLIGTKSENLTVVNTKDEIVRYDNVAEILFEYIIYMLGIYKKRKAYLLEKMQLDTIMNKEKIRFIQMINNDVIVLKNRKRKDIDEELGLKNFVKFDDCYDYLLNMRLASLTAERIGELEGIIKDDAAAIISLDATIAAKIWLDDLDQFEKFLKKGE